ncbi:MAG: glycosyltransferase family 4 protein [Ilumatobacter sp.]|nr:glycosyltransferase family 4 protein [Ilumatobacter sp.]
MPETPPDRPSDDAPAAEQLDWYVADLRRHGVRRVHVLAWRDLDDRDAGGSEVHADEFMRRWADRGLDVLHRTSAAVGLPAEDRRHGYDVVRRGSRYSVFPRTIAAELGRRMGPYDALVEIWNGVPWFSPLWCRRPRVIMFHHVHGPMWDQVMPGPLAPAGRFLEARLAPPFYRRELTVTPSEATRDELIELGWRPERVRAFPNGVDSKFSPGDGTKTEHPSLIAVGRLAPVKRFDRVIDAAIEARRRVPGLTLEIVGSGPLDADLQTRIDAAGASAWIRLVGKLTHDELVERYRRSWLVTSGSIAEGWGLSITEGAACGTPCVVTDIRGHRSSVRDGRSGVLVDPDRLGATIADVLAEPARLADLRAGALDWARSLSWDASALGITRALHDVVVQRR